VGVGGSLVVDGRPVTGAGGELARGVAGQVNLHDSAVVSLGGLAAPLRAAAVGVDALSTDAALADWHDLTSLSRREGP
jgi:hypothetical protein